MILPRLGEAKQLLRPHYLCNVLLSLTFIVAKSYLFLVICESLFNYEDVCEIDSREREILMFLAVVIVWKGRKATNWLHYISNVFLFSKIASGMLFLRADPLLGIVYVFLVLVLAVVFPEPMYDGPENITYFQMSISSVMARPISDTRRTVKLDLHTDTGKCASTSVHEDLDGDKSVHIGLGVLSTVSNINEKIGPALVAKNFDVTRQQEIDRLMLAQDGTDNKGEGLFRELTTNKKNTWIIMFCTTWSPDCRHVNPIFAELSQRFELANLKFGKLDIGRWAAEGERFRVNAHPTSRQLPTICVFEDGKEIRRRSLVNDKHRAIPFVFNVDNCVLEFDLINLYNKCKDTAKGKQPAAKKNA